MKGRNGHASGVVKEPVDLMAQVKESRMQSTHNPYIEVIT